MIELDMFYVLRNVLKLFILFSFTLGIFMNYCWASALLDQVSSMNETLLFWEPVAGMNGVVDLSIVLLIVYFIRTSWNNQTTQVDFYSKILFLFLSIPLFIGSQTHLVWHITEDIRLGTVGTFTEFMHVTELVLFMGVMALNTYMTTRRKVFNITKLNEYKNFILLISAVGMFKYFLFNVLTHQIQTFIKIASNQAAYSFLYTKSSYKNRDLDSNSSLPDKYLQPFTIIFCFVSFSYLIRFEYSDPDSQLDEYTRLRGDSISDDNSQRTESINSDFPNYFYFKIPSFSVILGILFFTLTLILVLIAHFSKANPNGKYIPQIYALPVYLLSIVILCVQIIEMKRWPKKLKSENVVDPALLYLGTAGQLFVSICSIKFYLDYSWNFPSTLTIIQNLILIFQVSIQFLVISVSLERKWIPPAVKTWQDFICPSFTLFCFNLGCFGFSIFENTSFNIAKDELPLFRKIFGNGFYSIGMTIAILQRFHSSIIFYKLIGKYKVQ